MGKNVPVLLLALVMGIGSCGGEEEEECADVDTSYQPAIDPANFVTGVTNPLYPLVPGTRYTYQADDETIVVQVTSDTKVVQGVTCIVVRDTVTVAGETTEDTFDWYAQDRDGNVWYMGEDTKEYEGGVVVSTEGSWEAGVDGAKAGIIMKASPAVGDSYRQEYLPCEAEDEAEVMATDESVSVPAGNYLHCLRTHDFTRLEPALNEDKYYCPGIGVVLEIDLNTGGRLDLVSFITP